MNFRLMAYIRDEEGIRLVGRNIKMFRLQQGLSQSQLAFEANIPTNQVGRIERGEINTSVSVILAIARVLNVHPRELFDFNTDIR
jgi:transcriptional regulator with XRE-family HTH domain